MVYVSDEKEEKGVRALSEVHNGLGHQPTDRKAPPTAAEPIGSHSLSSSSSLSTALVSLASAGPLALLPPPSSSSSSTPRSLLMHPTTSLSTGKKLFRARLGYVGALTTSSVGVLNAAVNVSTLATISEFASYATLFDEFFVHNFLVRYEPNNQFFGPCNVDPAAFLSWSTTLIIAAPLYHGSGTYTAASDMVNNIGHRVLNTGRPWTMKWINNESPTSGVMVSASTSSVSPTQGWCLTNSASAGNYTGLLQFRTSLPLPFTSAKTLGQTVIVFDVSFRARV
jgi:hypothetical protein